MSDVWKAIKEFLMSSKLDFEYEKIQNLHSLYEFIRDGKFLCDLLNYITGIDWAITLKSKKFTEKRALANISLFISGCEIELGMKKADLFEPSDLCDGANLRKVFSTLSVISHLEVCKKRNLRNFFCPPNMNVEISDRPEFCESSFISPTNDDEMLYESTSNIDEQDSLYMTADIFVNKSSAFYVSIENQNDKYFHSLSEFMKNEKNYYFGHLSLLSHIYDYLSQKINFSELEIIFNNFQNMKNVQNYICQSFNKVCSDVDHKTVAHTFTKYKHHFLEYVPYISRLNNANAYAEKIWKDQKIQKGIMEEAKKFDPNFRFQDLKSLLILPMQHITRYRLHLDTMIKYSSNNPTRLKELNMGREEISDILKMINTCEADEEAIVDIKFMESRLNVPRKMDNFTKLMDYGHLLCQTAVKINFLCDPKKTHTKHLIICSKLLILAKNVGSKYNLEKVYCPEEYKFQHNIDCDFQIKSISVFSEDSHLSDGFKIIFADEDILKSTIIKCIETFKVSNYLPDEITKGHFLRLHNFSGFVYCIMCKKLLHGILCQGYKCFNGDCDVEIHQQCLALLNECTYKATKRGRIGRESGIANGVSSVDSVELPAEDLSDQLWFYSRVGRNEVSDILKGKPDGYFLIRESKQGKCHNTISLTWENKIRHIQINEKGGYNLEQFRCFPTIRELIAYYQINSIAEAYPTCDTRLLRPPCNSSIVTVATKDSIPVNEHYLKFKKGSKLTVWCHFFPEVWTVEYNEKIGMALAYCFV